ncbi:MAG: hypothetical protein HGA51_10290 [Demequinaceae bacterium]|nr:hypothetical protein [Demequinaceae bacterium]
MTIEDVSVELGAAIASPPTDRAERVPLMRLVLTRHLAVIDAGFLAKVREDLTL